MARVDWMAPAVAALVIACEFGSTTAGMPTDDDGGSADSSTAEGDGATGGPASTDGATGDDQGDDDQGDDGSGDDGCRDEGECAPMLGPLHYENPCAGAMTRECPWANFCVMENEAIDTGTFRGDAGTTYDVTLRVRGVVSQILIVGGQTDGHFNVGGVPMPTNPFHPVRLDVSDPPGTYYLNAGPDQAEYCVAIDEEHVVPIAAGAEVTLGHYDTSSCSPLNADPAGMPVSLAGIEDPAQPYDGQFFRVDFVSAAPFR